MMNDASEVIGSPPFISYSINYEDVLLRRFFPGKTDGFFVDVGAQHPIMGNDFYGLYELGWHGINIEPNPSCFGLLELHRSRDQNLQVALSDVSGQELLFFEVPDTGLSTCDADQADVYAAQGYKIKRHTVTTQTLGEVLGAAAILPHIDILKVDVEGFEERVLSGNDWKKYRPSVIMVEVTFPQTATRRPSDIRRDLEAAGYHHFHFDNLNDFYADGSFRVPAYATMPPNVFDNFVLFETVALRNENTSLRENFNSAESYAHALETERNLLELAIPDLKAVISDKEIDLVRLHRYNQQLLQASRRSEASTRFACDIAVASILGHNDQVENALAVDTRPATRHHHEGPRQMGEQSKELVTLQDAAGTTEASTTDMIPSDLRFEFLNARIKALSAENSNLVNDIKDLQHENRRLIASTGQLQGENISLRRALGPAYSLNDEFALLRGLLEEHLNKLPPDPGQCSSIDTHGQENQSQIDRDAMDRRYNETINMLDAVYTSTSWRLTKPIRMLKRLTRF